MKFKIKYERRLGAGGLGHNVKLWRGLVISQCIHRSHILFPNLSDLFNWEDYPKSRTAPWARRVGDLQGKGDSAIGG